ncbi:unnamed protein product [Rhizophagus irregularis]|nr:unnamed protein product [Rhizophagus irregularis]
MEIEIDPREVFYSQDSIRPRFKDDNRHVEDTIRQLVKGKISPRHIERIRVCTLNGRMHSLDNRRLYVFKEAINRGGNFETVPASKEGYTFRTRYNYSSYTYDTDSDDDEDTNTFANTSYTRTPQYANTQYTSTQYTTPQYTTPQYTTPQYTTSRYTTPRYTTPQYTYSSTQNTEEENDSGWCVII